MGVLVRFEGKKLASGFSLMAIVLTLAFVNCVLIRYSLSQKGEDYYSEQELAAVYREIEGIYAQEQLNYLEEQISAAQSSLSESTDESSALSSYGALNAYHHVAEHIRKDLDYPAYLDEIQTQADSLSGSSLLSQTNTFSRKNAAATAAVYSRLESRSLSVGSSSGIGILTDWRLTDVFLLVSLLMFILKLTAEEKEGGYYQLLRIKPRGGAFLAAAKAIAPGFALLLLLKLFYGSIAMLLAGTVGFCDLNLPVQSLELFYTCPYDFSVGEFLIWFFLAKLGAFLTAMGCMLALCLTGHSNLSCCVLCGSVFAGEIILRSLIGQYSVFGILREANLITLLDTGHYFKTAMNYNFAGIPVSTVTAGACSAVLYSIVGFALAFFFWSYPVSVWEHCSGILLRTKKAPASFHVCVSLLCHEQKKLLRDCHALPCFIIFIGILLWMHGSSGSRFVQLTDYYYDSYSSVLSGILTEEKAQYLAEEEAWLNKAGERIQEYETMYADGLISEDALNYYTAQETISNEQLSAFAKVKEQYETLTESEDEGFSVRYLNEAGWDCLFGETFIGQEQIDFLLLLLCLILACSGFASMEQQTGMEQIEICSPHGRRLVLACKAITVMLFGGTAALAAFLIQIIHAGTGWGLEGWNCITLSSKSITVLPNAANCSVTAWLVLQMLIRIAYGMLAALAVLILSEATGRTLSAILGSFVLLGIPVTVQLLGLDITTPDLLIMTNRLNIVPTALLVIVFAVAVLVALLRISTHRRKILAASLKININVIAEGKTVRKSALP